MDGDDVYEGGYSLWFMEAWAQFTLDRHAPLGEVI